MKWFFIAMLAVMGALIPFGLAEHNSTASVGYQGYEEWLFYTPYLVLCYWIVRQLPPSEVK